MIKIEKKLQNMYLTYYSLFIVKGLWQGHYQILSKIFLKEFMERNVNTDAMIKNVKLVELNISIATVFLKAQRWFISYNQKYHGKLNKKLKE